MCNIFGIKKSSFYKHLSSARNPKKVDLKKIVTMKVIAQKTRYSYGSRRMSIELKNEGFSGGRHATKTFMKKHGIVSEQRRKKRFYGTTKIKAEGQNILNREFTVTAPNEVWCGDITEIATKEGKLYLAGIMDLFSRKIIGYEMDKNMREQLPINALEKASAKRFNTEKTVHHSDRGSQYVGKQYSARLKKYSFTVSLNEAGKCLDNAVKERFWGTLKSEWIKGNVYATRKEAIKDIQLFIDFYNKKRLHSTLGYISPDDFENRYYEKLAN